MIVRRRAGFAHQAPTAVEPVVGHNVLERRAHPIKIVG